MKIGTSKEDLDRYSIRLEELRLRLIVCAVAVSVDFLISLFFNERFFQVLVQPLHKALAPG